MLPFTLANDPPPSIDDPPSIPSDPFIIFMPFDSPSVVLVLVAAGVLILGLCYAPKLGFALTHRLIRKLWGPI